MESPSLLSPIDDDELTARIVAAARAADRELLSSAELPRAPGGYLLFVAPGPDGVPDPLGPVGQGQRPIYAGAAASLSGRVRRYRSPQSLRGACGFPYDRLWIAVVPTRTLAGALLVEGVLIETWHCPFNSPELSGLGSRMPGVGRLAHQRVSPWDTLYRRPWAGVAPVWASCAARLALASRIADPRAAVPTWPPLPVVGTPPDRGGEPGTRAR